MKHALALFVLLASALFTMLHAQDVPAAKPASPTAAPKSAVMPSPAAATKDPVATSVRMLLPRSQKNILGAIEAMPGEKFAFKPTADQMSFGHLTTHIIESNYFLCAKAADVPEPKAEAAKETDPKEKLLAAAKGSFDFCGDSLAKKDDSKLGDSVELFGGRQFPRAMAALGLASGRAARYPDARMPCRLNN